MVLVNNLTFFHLFIYGKISQQNVLFMAKSASKMCLMTIILERKMSFFGSKIKKLTKSKSRDFSKG